MICFQKPYEGKPVDCITATGAGALWIDGARIGLEGMEQHRTPAKSGLGKHGIYGASTVETIEGKDLVRYTSKGRWPANFVLTHHPDCRRVGTKRVRGSRIEKPCDYRGNPGAFGNAGNRPARGIGDSDGYETIDAWDCHPDCPVRHLGEQSGERKGFQGFAHGAERKASKGRGGYHGNFPTALTSQGHNDTGTAARFFFQADWSYEVAERLARADPVWYAPKASRKERDMGLEGVPVIMGHSTYNDYAGTPEHATNKNGKLRNTHHKV